MASRRRGDMMPEMVRFPLGEVAKLTSGLGVLLLLAAQEKAFPRPLVEPKSAPKAIARALHGPSQPLKKPRQPQEPAPVRVLWDAIPPRWLGQLNDTHARQTGFRKSECGADGLARAGTGGQGGPPPAAVLSAAFGFQTNRPPRLDVLEDQVFAIFDSAVVVCISETGPPVYFRGV